WNPSSVTVDPGNTVTWSNDTAYSHNICVAKPGDTPQGLATDPTGASCTEFRNGAPAAGPWSAMHTFTAAGTYKFICQEHTNITGTVQVAASGTTTTTSTSSGTTSQTTTQTTTADTTPPTFTGARKRRASRRSLIVSLGSSEDRALAA